MEEKDAALDERGRPRSNNPFKAATAVPLPSLPPRPELESGRTVPGCERAPLVGVDCEFEWEADLEVKEKGWETEGEEWGEPGAGAVATERTEREDAEGARDAAYVPVGDVGVGGRGRAVVGVGTGFVEFERGLEWMGDELEVAACIRMESITSMSPRGSVPDGAVELGAKPARCVLRLQLDYLD